MPQGTNHIWYLTVILSHNNLFVPHWHYTLIYGLSVQNVTFLSEIKYTWIIHFYFANHLSVHTLWQIWIQEPRHNLFHWELPHIKDTVDGYLISIPTRHNLSRSLHFSSFIRYLNLFRGVMKCYVNVLFYSTCLIIMTILIICSFLLQRILLEPIGLLRFRRILDSVI